MIDSIEEYASQGFRTLTFAMKTLDNVDVDGIFERDDIESNLSMLGATCVEDLL